MPDWLDLILIALITMFSVSGYRQGFVAGMLSLTGLACGAATGALAAGGIFGALAPVSAGREIITILIEFAAAITGMLLATRLAVWLRRRTGHPAGLADSVGGAVLSAVFLCVVTVIASSLAVTGPPGLVSRQIHRSLVLRALAQLTPQGTANVVKSLRVSMVTQLAGGSGLDPADLPPPSRSVLVSPAAALARRGVVKIRGVVRPCRPARERRVAGSGLVIGPQYVLTNAHVVAGLARPPVVTLAGGRTLNARVVWYDRRRDVAVLYVPGLRGTVLHFTGPPANGAPAIVAGFPGGGALRLTPATIGSSMRAAITGTDTGATVDLQVYLVRGQIRSGDSGGALMAPGGGVYGMVFATRPGVPAAGWAMTRTDVASDAAAGTTRTTSVPTPASLSC